MNSSPMGNCDRDSTVEAVASNELDGAAGSGADVSMQPEISRLVITTVDSVLTIFPEPIVSFHPKVFWGGTLGSTVPLSRLATEFADRVRARSLWLLGNLRQHDDIRRTRDHSKAPGAAFQLRISFHRLR